MFLLYKFKRLGDRGADVDDPIDWSENENDVYARFLQEIGDPNVTLDYIEVENPCAFSQKLSTYKHNHKVEGYAIAELPNFDPSKVRAHLNPRVTSQDFVRRFDKFDLREWRKTDNNERKLCDVLGIVYQEKRLA